MAPPQLNLLVGDLSYADTYIANGSLDPGLTNHTWDEHLSKKYKRLPWRKMPSYPLSGSFQPRWCVRAPAGGPCMGKPPASSAHAPTFRIDAWCRSGIPALICWHLL